MEKEQAPKTDENLHYDSHLSCFLFPLILRVSQGKDIPPNPMIPVELTSNIIPSAFFDNISIWSDLSYWN